MPPTVPSEVLRKDTPGKSTTLVNSMPSTPVTPNTGSALPMTVRPLFRTKSRRVSFTVPICSTSLRTDGRVPTANGPKVALARLKPSRLTSRPVTVPVTPPNCGELTVREGMVAITVLPVWKVTVPGAVNLKDSPSVMAKPVTATEKVPLGAVPLKPAKLIAPVALPLVWTKLPVGNRCSPVRVKAKLPVTLGVPP